MNLKKIFLFILIQVLFEISAIDIMEYLTYHDRDLSNNTNEVKIGISIDEELNLYPISYYNNFSSEYKHNNVLLYKGDKLKGNIWKNQEVDRPNYSVIIGKSNGNQSDEVVVTFENTDYSSSRFEIEPIYDLVTNLSSIEMYLDLVTKSFFFDTELEIINKYNKRERLRDVVFIADNEKPKLEKISFYKSQARIREFDALNEWFNHDVTIDFLLSDNMDFLFNVEPYSENYNINVYYTAKKPDGYRPYSSSAGRRPIVGKTYTTWIRSNSIITLKVYDAVGNFDTFTVEIDKIDKTRPTVEFLGEKKAWYNKSDKLEYNISIDDGSPISIVDIEKNDPNESISWDIIFNKSKDSRIILKNLQEGSNRIKINNIEDEAGNKAHLSGDFNLITFNYDTKAPDIKIGKKDLLNKKYQVTVDLIDKNSEVSGLDRNSIRYVVNPNTSDINSIPETEWIKGPLPILSANSNNEIVVEIKDNAGNVTRKLEVIDVKKPELKPKKDYSKWINKAINLEFEVTDDSEIVIDSWKIKYENKGWTTIDNCTRQGASILLTDLKEGVNNIYIKVSDEYGNTKEYHQIIKFDSKTPNVSKLKVVNPINPLEIYQSFIPESISQWSTAWFNKDVKILAEHAVDDNISESSPIQIDYSRNKKDYTPIQAIFTADFTRKEILYIKVSDEAGNKMDLEVLVNIDITSPVFNINKNILFQKSITNSVLKVKSLPVIDDISLNIGYTAKTEELEYSFTEPGSDAIWSRLSSNREIPLDLNFVKPGENLLHFRFKDKAGNYGYTNLGYFYDNIGPTIKDIGTLLNPYIPNIDINSRELVVKERPTWNENDTDSSTLEYYIGSSQVLTNPESVLWTTLPENNKIKIPKELVKEGKYYIFYKVLDTLDNPGYVKDGLEIYLDKTKPVVESLKAYEKLGETYRLVSTIGYSKELDVYIEPTATDSFALDVAGEIDSYILYHTTDPSWSEKKSVTFTKNSENKYPLVLSNGINYIKIVATDRAGNNSENITLLPVLVDSLEPNNLVITSKTHRNSSSYTDSQPFSTAYFHFDADSGASGIKEYIYSLYRDYPEDYYKKVSAPILGGVSGNTLELVNLEDNIGDSTTGRYQFYFLEVTPVSGNGKSGTKKYYQFRVDTKAPANLVINSKTHPLEKVYYMEKNALFTWMEPTDLTGIKSYYYKFIDHGSTDNLSKELKDENVNNWKPITNRILEEDLTLYINGGNKTGYGEVTLRLCAEDWANNRKFDNHTVTFDINRPIIEPFESDIYFNINANSYSDSIDYTFSWNSPTDPESGVKKQELILQIVEGSQYKQVYPLGDGIEKLGAEDNSFTVYGLNKKSVNYRLVLNVYDNAGNKATYNQFFDSTGKIDVNTNYSLPFDNLYYGYRVVGQTLMNSWAKLFLPKNFNLKKENKTLKSLPLTLLNENITEFESGIYLLDKKNQSPLNLVIAGFPIKAYGLQLNDSGLSLLETSLIFGKTELLFNSDLIISSSRALNIKKTVTAKSDIKQFIAKNSWEINSNENFNFSLVGESLRIDRGSLPIIPKVGRGFKIHNGVKPIFLKDIVVDSEFNLLEADFEVSKNTPFYIETDKYKIKVLNAIVRDNRILIEEGEFVVDNLDIEIEGKKAFTIPFKDLIVNYNGKVSHGLNFSSAPFSYSLNGVTYTVTNNLELTENGLLTTGSFIFNGTTYQFSNQVINRSGVDIEISADINTKVDISDFAGYQFTASNVKLKGSDLYIKEAQIKLPTTLGDLTDLKPINNSKELIISVSDFKVISEGIWTIENTVTKEHAFGPGLTFKSIKLSQEFNKKQISFPEVVLTRNSNLTEPVINFHNITFKDISLNREGGLEASKITSESNIRIGNFNYIGKNLKLMNNSVEVDSLELISTEIKDNHLDNLIFTGFSFNGNGVRTYAESNEEREFIKSGWNFRLKNIKQFKSNLTSLSTLILPEKNDRREISFNNFILKRSGEFISGITSFGQFINIGGWRVFANEISVNDSELNIVKGEVKLFSTMGGSLLSFKNIKINSKGNLLNSAENIEDINFLSENGFNVEAKKYKLSDSGILLNGNVKLPNALQNSEKTLALSFNDFHIVLKPNGYINTLKLMNGINYRFGGFKIEADSVLITDSGLNTDKNAIIGINFFSKNLGEIQYFSSGEIKYGGEEFTPFTISPFGSGKVDFTIRSVKLTENGINLKSFVSLPKGFAAEELFFDSLTLHPNGTITSDLSVKKLTFDKFGTAFNFSDIYLASDGFTIGEAAITLPESMENRQINLTNFKVKFDGSFDLGSSNVDPFEMWGYTFYIDDLGFGKLPTRNTEGISFKGGVRLPLDLSVRELAGRKFDITNLEVPYSGDIKFNVGLTEIIDMRLFNKWDMSITGITLDNDFNLIINEGTIDLPKEFYTPGSRKAKLTINNITINPKDKKMDVKSVYADDISYKYSGLDFKIETVKLSQDRGLDVINGSVTIPKNDPDKPKYPQGLDNTTLYINKLQVKNNFTLGDFDVSAYSTREVAMYGDLFILQPLKLNDPVREDSWKIGLIREGGNLFLSVSAVVELAGNFPSGIKGSKLKAGNSLDDYGIRVNVATGTIEKFIVKGTYEDTITGKGRSYNLFGNSVDTKELGFIYIEDEDRFEVEVNKTTIILNNPSVPYFLRNTKCYVKEFVIDDKGQIKKLNSTIELNERKAFPNYDSDIYIYNWKIGMSKVKDKDIFDFTVLGNGVDGNQIEFGNSFPKGIAGSKTSINSFSINSLGIIDDIDFNLTLSNELTMFSDVLIRGVDKNNRININSGANIRFLKDEKDTKIFNIILDAGVKLPNTLPSGLAGLELSVHEFTFKTNGSLDKLGMGIAGENLKILNYLDLNNWALNVTSGSVSTQELFLEISGDIELPENVSSVLGSKEKMTLNIDDFRVSTKRGILNFNAGISGEILSADLYAGMTFSFEKIKVATSGVSLGGSLTIPDSLVSGIDPTVALHNLTVDWSGEITDIDASIEGTQNVAVGGFNAELTNLRINPKKINVESLFINISGFNADLKLGFEEAGFDYNGNFFGKPVLDKVVTPDIAGFKLALHKPNFNLSKQEISFDKVNCILPDIIGNAEASLNGLKINPEGIQLTGGGFILPPFELSDQVKFKNVGVDFYLEDNQYVVRGGGNISIKIETFDVDVSFTNISSKYPIGLKKAYFAWQTTGVGIAIPNTGVSLTGLRGGVVFGEPEEIPYVVRDQFGDGCRIQLGVSLVDSSSAGMSIKGSGDFWIDIGNANSAVDLFVDVKCGMATGEFTSAITNRGFTGVGNVRVYLDKLRGTIKIYIFDHNGKTIVNGSAQVDFGFKKGYFFSINTPWKSYGIPDKDLFVSGPKAEFGTFKTSSGDKTGVKGSIDPPWWDEINVFVSSSGSLKTNVRGYDLYTPYNSRNRSFDSGYTEKKNSKLFNFDTRGKDIHTDLKNFMVKASDNNLMARSGRSSIENNQEEVGKLLFVIAYSQGDPRVTAISPSGLEFSPGDENTRIKRTDYGSLLIVNNPEAGEWSLKVENMPSPDSYEIQVFGTTKQDRLYVDSFGYKNRSIDTPLNITGYLSSGINDKNIEVYVAHDSGEFRGYMVSEGRTDNNGSFSIPLDPNLLDDGENYIYVRVDGGLSPDLKEFIGGSLYINNSNKILPPVENLVVYESVDSEVIVSFDPLDNGRVKHYRLTVKDNLTNKIVSEFNINSYRYRLPRLEEDKSYTFQIIPVDSNGRDGEASKTFTFKTNSVPEDKNKISINQKNVKLSIYPLESVSSYIDINIDNPILTNSAYDFVKAEILDIKSSGITAYLKEDIFNITSGSANIELITFADTKVVPGEYSYKLRVYNMGNSKEYIDLEIPINVEHPPLLVEEISPKYWEEGGTGNFEIYGSGFIDGTRLLIDGVEIPTIGKTFNRLEAKIPSEFNQGEIVLSVISPGGEKGDITVETSGPTWSIISYKSYSEVKAGDKTKLFFTIVNKDGFRGSVPFKVGDLPEGWVSSFINSNAAEGLLSEIEIAIPENALNGSYFFNITDIDGNAIPCEIFVTADPIEPRVSSLSEIGVVPGNELKVFGFGFGGNGVVYIGDKLQQVLSWDKDIINIKTDNNLVAGDLKVVVNGVESNSIPLSIKNIGFSIYPSKDLVKMQPGESREVSIAVSGFSESVNLNIKNENIGINAYIKDSYLELNGNTELVIKTDNTITNGKYPLVISGYDGTVRNSESITVQIGDAFEFVNNTIPPFMEGVTTSYNLGTKHGDGDIRYSLKDGDLLPAGLILKKDGEITGKVLYGEESSTVTIIARDEEKREISKDYNIIVLENSWPLNKKTGGKSSYNPTPSPAEASLKWISKSGNLGKDILVANNRVFIRRHRDITVLDAASGIKLYTIRGEFNKYFYASKTLFTLDSSGIFTAWESNLGNKKWSREGVKDFTTDGFTLLITDQSNCKEISLSDGQLIGESNIEFANNMIWFKNRLLKSDKNGIYIYNGSSWQKVYDLENSEIYSMVSDDNSLIVTTESGQIYSLDKDFKLLNDNNLMIYRGDMVLTEENIIIYNSGDTLIVDRHALKVKRRFNTAFGNLISAKEKLFFYGELGLEARNIYSGGSIWRENTPIEDVVIVGEELFALDSTGSVKCYNGRDNILPPTTTILSTPAEPDGKLEYYITTPEVELRSLDPETYVKDIKYRYDNGQYKTYIDTISLPDGEFSLTAYGVDSNNLRGLTDIKYFKVDTSVPISMISNKSVEGDSGFTVSDITLNLSAEDTGSGLDNIYYTLNGETKTYTRPIYIDSEGSYQFVWWSEDRAGNSEERRVFNFSIDLYKPTLSSELYKDDNSAVVYLFAEDSFSGVNRIEYKVNGSDINSYLDPINLTPGHLYNITYRAIDNAGQTTEWHNIVFDTTDVDTGCLIEDFETKWGIGNRYIHNNLQVGDSLYLNYRGKNNITSLPDYLVGGDMIMSNFTDKYSWDRDFYKFEAGKDIDLYIVKNKKSALRLDRSWVKIANNLEIAKGQFFGGADIYYKSFKEGDDIEIYGTAMWQPGGPNLIIAKESLTAGLNIFSPNPGKELYPNSNNWFAATAITGEIERKWSYRFKGEDWIDLGSRFSGSFNLPYSHRDTEIELRVEVKVKNIIDPNKTEIITKIREYQVRNLAELLLRTPVSGSQVLLNNSTKIDFKILGIDGREKDSNVSWRTDNGSVENGLYTPLKTGLAKLEVSYNTFKEYIRRDELIFNVVKKWQKETFSFDKSLIGEYKKQSDSRYYGFTDSVEDRLGETTYIVIPKGKSWSNNRITKMYIALEKEKEFNYLVNNGLYRIKVTLGPVRKNDFPFLKIEDKHIDINAKHKREIYEIETSVIVKDNMFSLTGSQNLQVISFDIIRTESPIDTKVKAMNNYRIIKDQKWYKWNPEHYFPDRDNDDDEEGDDIDD